MTITIKLLGLALLLGASVGCDSTSATAGGDFELAFRVREHARAADTGLPTYPGARPYKEANDSSDGANMALATPWFDLKVVALKLESNDSPQRVASFYHRALSKYGEVLDCSNGTRRINRRSEDSQLECEDDDRTSEIVYKVGTEEDQRVVAIKPHGRGARFSLVHVGGGERS